MSSQARRLTTVVFVVATLTVGFFATAPSAFAHHPEITGTTACGYKVDWTASSWSPGKKEGAHPHILVEYQLNGSGPWTLLADEAFTTSKGSFSGSFVAPGTPTSIRLRARPDARYRWENGTRVTSDQTRRTDSIVFPTDCDIPSASAVLSCAEGGVAVTLRNDGTTPSVFDVTIDGVVVSGGDDVVVNGGTTKAVVVAMDEDATATIVASASGEKVFEQSFTRDCVKPGATIVADCASGGATVTLTNEGELPGEFEVLVDGEVVKTVTVDGGDTVTETVTVDEGDTVTVSVKESGTELATLEVTTDCVKPAATSTLDCAKGGVVFTFTNPGAELPVNLLVTKDGAELESVEVDVDEAVEKTYALEEDSISAFKVTGPGYDSGELSFTYDCEEEEVTPSGEPEPEPEPEPEGELPFRDSDEPGGSGGELPRTGALLLPIALAGAALAATGSLMVRASGRRRENTPV